MCNIGELIEQIKKKVGTISCQYLTQLFQVVLCSTLHTICHFLFSQTIGTPLASSATLQPVDRMNRYEALQYGIRSMPIPHYQEVVICNIYLGSPHGAPKCLFETLISTSTLCCLDLTHFKLVSPPPIP